ncbi:glycosyl-4,4'-diaponeurosporenoate acyltransferase [Pseudalkalibacillus hwajinpoensis]|uniref:Glycosyl-4,4'-diaponeurosporenoate acyltransferase n=1 Tax=Guptibacillus hwajinpoensis TaxID=208199 RepID=A0A4V5Q3F6_9BACL|nr:glycosyl-4,4'-diaponeurosporenoate acyltransferase [Pseudalkalibacillus hwajinpoensis]TKD71468.1 glycosyl-4,4'-diaponeurosporenoate acyltransferase [Pseudalkalibacillus hwajinpoensis]
MQVIELSISLLVIVNILAWLVIHVVLSYICLRLPDSFYESKKSTIKLRKWEFALYKTARVRKWKTILPDGGGVFRGGFRKKELKRLSSLYLSKFILETRRAEVTHWILIPPAVLFFLWNPPIIGWIMIGYALLVNIPFIMIQRYNRYRFKPLLKKQMKRDQFRGTTNESF